MIAKLVNAGYLRPECQHDADAITSAIAKMKEDLRTGEDGDGKAPQSARTGHGPCHLRRDAARHARRRALCGERFPS